MDDSELTKKAIQELLKDIIDSKEKDGLPTERKKNPLGKPNKRFLGRTINSMMRHNKRQSDNNHRKCQRKLRELDAKQRKRERRQNHGTLADIRIRSRTESLHEVISSNCEDRDHKEKKHNSFKKIERKRRKKRQKLSSPSSSSSNSGNSSSCSISESSGSTIPSKVKKHKNRKAKKDLGYINNDENVDKSYSQVAPDSNVGYYIDPHMAYAAMAYGHINQMYHQQMVQQQETIRDELEESIEIPSDLSLSYHSESSLNISLHSSSAEEDENGILTFKLLSSDEERISPNSKKINAKRKTNEEHDIVTLAESDDNSKTSVKSCISLESTTSEKHNGQTDEILLLSSSTSDCDDLELIEAISEPKQIEAEIVDEKKDAIVDIKTKTNMDRIENILNTNEENLPENKEEDEIMRQSIDTEKIETEFEEEKGEVNNPTNGNKITKEMENAEESVKNNIIKYHNGEINVESMRSNTSRTGLSENYINITIDLTEG